jgi:geranylgeranyl diphosphate synthase, type II
MLLHFMRTAAPADRDRAATLLSTPRLQKDPDEVRWLGQAMIVAGSLEHGRALALEYSHRALEVYDRLGRFTGDGEHGRFLREMLRYVIDRVK